VYKEYICFKVKIYIELHEDGACQIYHPALPYIYIIYIYMYVCMYVYVYIYVCVCMFIINIYI